MGPTPTRSSRLSFNYRTSMVTFFSFCSELEILNVVHSGVVIVAVFQFEIEFHLMHFCLVQACVIYLWKPRSINMFLVLKVEVILVISKSKCHWKVWQLKLVDIMFIDSSLNVMNFQFSINQHEVLKVQQGHLIYPNREYLYLHHFQRMQVSQPRNYDPRVQFYTWILNERQ